MTHKIAIVIPVYNVARYLPECLDSVLSQTYKNFTVFAIDDGATDNSGKILDEYASKDNRIKVTHKSNGGVSSARNVALEQIEATGNFDYITFIDSDDRVVSNYLAKLTETIKTDNSDIVACGRYTFDTKSKHIKDTTYSKETINNEQFVELVFSFGKWGKTSCNGGYSFKLFRSEILSGIRYTNDRKIVEDELFCLEAAIKATKISILPEPLYGYRMRAESLTHKANFTKMLLKSRELCIPVAASISKHAHLVAVSAYLQTALSLLKNEGQLASMHPNIVSKNILNELFYSGLCSKKNISLYRMFERHPTISKIYLKTRATFRTLFRKENKKQNNFFP